MERYSGPWSQNCPLVEVGSMLCQYTSSSLPELVRAGSNTTCTDSACPVRPVPTSSYRGLATVPPEYPEVAETTPRTCSNAFSIDQKHPPANTAVSVAKAYGAGAGGAAAARVPRGRKVPAVSTTAAAARVPEIMRTGVARISVLL